MADQNMIYFAIVGIILLAMMIYILTKRNNEQVESLHDAGSKNQVEDTKNNMSEQSPDQIKEKIYKNDLEQIKKIKSLLKNLSFEVKKITNSGEISEIVAQIDSVLENIESPLLVTVLGEFSSGKSTFINALLEEQILAMKVRPTTATITKIQYSPNRKLEVHFRNGKSETHDIRNLHTVTVENFVAENNILDEIAYVQLEMEKDFLKSIDLADTPGFNSNCERHSEITAEFIKHSDIVFWLFNANQLEKKTTFALIEKHCRFSKPVGVINMIDQILENETESESKKYIDELITRINPFVEKAFALSSKYALSQDRRGKSGIDNIMQYFRKDIIPNAYKTKKIIMINKLSGIAADINKLRNNIVKVTAEHKSVLDKFKEQVGKYKIDSENFEKSIANWNQDVKKQNNEYMVHNVSRYFLVNGVMSNIETKAKSLSTNIRDLNSENKRLDTQRSGLTRKKIDLDNEYKRWLNAFNEYNNKIGKNMLDAAWKFFTGEDFTEEKNNLNKLSNEYDHHQDRYNSEVDIYNNSLNSLNSKFERLSDSILDFLNNVVKTKMEEQYAEIEKQQAAISAKEGKMKKLETEYGKLAKDLQIFDGEVFQCLSSILNVINTNEIISKQGKISDYASLISNYKKHNDGYVDLDWKELYSRHKINAIVAGQATGSEQKTSATYQQNQNRPTRQV